MSKTPWSVGVSLTFAALVVPVSFVAGADQDSVADLLTRHKAALDRIATVQTKALKVYTGPSKQTTTTTFIKKGDEYRYTETSFQNGKDIGGILDILVTGGVARVVSRFPADGGGRGQYTFGASRKQADDLLCFCDPWLDLGLEFPTVKGLGRYPLAKLIADAKSVKVSSDSHSGNPCTRLDVVQDLTESGVRRELSYWFDPKRNDLVSKYEYRVQGERLEFEVVEFLEYEPGRFFPQALHSNHFDASD